MADLQHVVDAALAAELAREPAPALPPGVRFGVACCAYTSVAGAPAGAPLVVYLPTGDDPLLSGEVFMPLGTGWVVAATGELVATPNFAAARSVAVARAREGSAALATAQAKLHTLPLYATWRQSKVPYTTSLVPRADGSGTWVYFTRAPSPDDGAPDRAGFELDGAGAIVHGWTGPERTPVPR
jgi:hypothetical protein